MLDWPATTMWRKLLYSGFETCFGATTQGAGTQGAGTQTHLKFRFCAIFWERRSLLQRCGLTSRVPRSGPQGLGLRPLLWPGQGAKDTASIYLTPCTLYGGAIQVKVVTVVPNTKVLA